MASIKIHKLSKSQQDNIYNSLHEKLNINNPQSYYPILSLYFDFNNNYSDKCFTFKSKYIIDQLIEKIDINDNDVNYIKHLFKANVLEINSKKIHKENVFVKLSPILDVVQYMMNMYKVDNSKLPNIHQYITNIKINSRNNTSYIDAFSCFINSKLTELNLCPTFPIFYGTFSGVVDEFDFNISDEYSEMKHESWFNKNKEKLYDIVTVENDYFSFSEDSDNESLDGNVISNDFVKELNIDDIEQLNIKKFSDILNLNFENNNLDADDEDEEERLTNNPCNSSNSENEINSLEVKSNESNISSDNESNNSSVNESNNSGDNESNNSGDNESNNSNDNESDSDGNWEDVSDSDVEISESGILNLDQNPDLIDLDESENLDSMKYTKFTRLKDFPVQIICMEDCGKTLDQLIEDKKYNISDLEWRSILFQICFGLSVSQKRFNFVHNDLHSSNIMLKEIDQKYLYFHKSGTFYKVPTFNKLTKIIDFGRATFNIENNIFFSDVFSRKGDAEGQYSYPYHNTFKNCKIRPNKSFDLARLSTTIIEHFEEDSEIWNFLSKLITDKYGICYVNHPDDFELYLKIARNIESAIPKNQLNKPLFNQFIINKDDIPEKSRIYYY